MSGLFRRESRTSRTSDPERIDVQPADRRSQGSRFSGRISQPDSDVSRGPAVQLSKRGYMRYTLLPWFLFLLSFVAFTFCSPTTRSIPFVFVASLAVLAALLTLPHPLPYQSNSASYLREDVVTCVALILSATLFALFCHSEHAAVGYVALILGSGYVAIAADVRIAGQRDKRISWMDNIPFWHCVVAMLIGSLTGYYNFSQHMLPYHGIYRGNEYIDVLARGKADAYADFGKMVFADEIRIETQYSVGYKRRHMYCVAPILEADQTEVEFWAVGKDCCSSRGGFWCTASGAYSVVTTQIASASIDHSARYTAEEFWVLDSGAQAAVPYVRRPFADGWDVYGSSDSEGFAQARAIAKAMYQLTESPTALMVLWTSNPTEVQYNLLASAWTSFAFHAFIYLVVCMSTAFFAPKSFEEARQQIVPLRFEKK